MKTDLGIKILTQEQLIEAGCFDVNKAIEICEKALVDFTKGDILFPDKISLVFDKTTQNRINCLPAAVLSEKVYGMKWVSVFPENPHKRNVQNLSAVILLSELESGFPVAFMEGTLCSNLRTAAVGAIGAKYLARKDSRTIGFIGAGEQAKAHFLTMKEVFPQIQVCKVASRTTASEEKFISQMKKFYPSVEFVACLGNCQEAAENSDIIVTAISGQEKVLQAEWISDGAFYCHVAGLEDDFGVALKANKIVCDDWNVVKHRTQTISQMYAQGLLQDNDIYADLCEIILGNKPGRENEKEFIYFNSVGLSYLDISLSNWMYKKAELLGKGTYITMQEKSMFEFDRELVNYKER